MGSIGNECGYRDHDANHSTKPLFPVAYPTAVGGGVAIAMYGWLYGLAVVDADRNRVNKAKDSADS